MTTDDEWADALRSYARSAYPPGGGPDPELVVRAGRRRRTIRRTAGASAACALVAALALGIPPLVDRASHPIAPVASPSPTTSSTPAVPAPTPTPSTPQYPGILTTLPPTGTTDPVAAGALPAPATLDDVHGVMPMIIGTGDGTVLPVAVTPTAYDDSDVFPSYRSGFGLWTPGGAIDWITDPPSTPERGPQTVEAAVSADWIVWFESDSANSYEAPYVLWARPRSGGDAREIAHSPQSPDDAWPYAVYDHQPAIVDDTLFWYDEVYEGDATVDVVMSAPLDGPRPATVVVRNAMTLTPDRCTDDDALFVVTGTGADADAHRELHRIGVGADGSAVSDRTVDDDLAGAREDVRAVAACGDTVAVAHDIDPDSVDRGSWLEIRQAGASTRTVVWPKGTGSSIGGLAAGPGFLTWYLYNGQYSDDVYLFDLASQRLYEFSAQQARNRVATDGTFVWWLQPTPESDTYRWAAARVTGR